MLKRELGTLMSIGIAVIGIPIYVLLKSKNQKNPCLRLVK